MRRHTIEKHVVQGGRELERGSFRRALQEFRAVVARDPDDARTWLRIAELHTRLGEGPEALSSYSNAADIHVRKGFLRHALALYKNILALVPEDLEALGKVADLSAQLGLVSDATLQYESLLRVCQNQDRNQEALAALRCILKLNPTDVRIQVRFAETALKLGYRDEALEKLRSAAELLKASARIDEYLRVCEHILSEEPHNMALARELAKGYLVRGNGRLALARLRMCYDNEPKDAEVLELMAQAFTLLGKTDKAALLLRALGQVHRDQGRASDALDTLHRALDLRPNDREIQRTIYELDKRSLTPVDLGIDVDMDMDMDLAEPAAPHAMVTEEETLKMYMPAFVTHSELEAVTDQPTDESFDLFPVQQARKLASDIGFLMDKTATKLRRLIGILPLQMQARQRLQRASEVLTPGGTLVTELSTLCEELQSNNWIESMHQAAKG